MSSEQRRSYRFGAVEFSPARKTLHVITPGAPKLTLILKEKDAKILTLLCEHLTGTNEDLFAAAWREPHTNSKQLVYNAIGRLRKHLEDVGLGRKAIENSRDEGYTLTIPPEPIDDPDLPATLLYEVLPHHDLAMRCHARVIGGTIETTGARVTEDQNPVDLINERDPNLYDDLQFIQCAFLLLARTGGTIAGRLVACVINGFLTRKGRDPRANFRDDPDLLKTLANLRIIFTARGNTDPVYVLNAHNQRLGEVFTCHTGTTATRTHQHQDATGFAAKLFDGLPNDKNCVIHFAPDVHNQDEIRHDIAAVLDRQPWAAQVPGIIDRLLPAKRPTRKAPGTATQVVSEQAVQKPTKARRTRRSNKTRG